jgi:hypothetical protein
MTPALQLRRERTRDSGQLVGGDRDAQVREYGRSRRADPRVWNVKMQR